MKLNWFDQRSFFVTELILMACVDLSLAARSSHDRFAMIEDAETIRSEARSAIKTWTVENYRKSVELYLAAAERFESQGAFREASSCFRDAAAIEISLGSN